MPLIYQKMIYRKDLQNNPNQLYVFGDNLLRKGKRGQAAEMRGEPNAIGIATKFFPSLREAAFFTDARWPEIKPHLEADFNRVEEALLEGKTVVWPEDGIGSGLSQLPKRAPQIWAVMESIRWQFESIKPS